MYQVQMVGLKDRRLDFYIGSIGIEARAAIIDRSECWK